MKTDFSSWKILNGITKLSTQKHVQAIRDGMISTIPLTIIGSFFLILAFPPVPEDSFLKIWSSQHILKLLIPFRVSLGLISLYATFNIGASLAKSYKLDSLSGGTLAFLAFLLTIIPVSVTDHGWVLPMAYLGGAGLFVGIITSIFAVEILRFFKTHNLTIKMPEGVPPSVARSFENLFPALAIFIIIPFITLFLEIDLHLLLNELFAPLKVMVGKPYGAVIIVLLTTLLWSLGIHGVAIIGTFARPIWIEMIAENGDALSAGAPIPHITPEPFYQWFVWIGGSGGTLGLAFLLLFARSAYLKKLGKTAILPAVFNINEPLVFGVPIMLNPFMVIPFIIAPLVATCFTYFVINVGFVDHLTVTAPWTFPAPIGAFLATSGDYRAIFLCLFNILIMTAIYFPFFLAYDRKMLNEEIELASGTKED